VTPIEEHLQRRMALEGPLTLADYMSDVLGHPRYGYYICRDPFGQVGDFTTAPEISQMFGELLGLWALETWRRMGEPSQIHLVELGPGRGTLMADFLRATRRMPAFLEAADLHLVETSPVLRQAQAKALETSALSAHWHGDVATLPEEAPLLIIANEFFDALPIRQFQKTPTGWRERLVTFHPQTDQFGLALAKSSSPAEAWIDPAIRASATEGQIVELCPLGWRIAGDIGHRLQRQGGAALLIDYGYEGPETGETLQALKAHQYCSIFETPGEADLTAHVDFSALSKAAGEAGARATSLSSQGDFLRALGIDYRAQSLKQASPHTAISIQESYQRLIDPDQMGTLFKVLGLSNMTMPALAGLEAE
jgi:SAM-dependent MidA family methyltransferase